MKRGILIRRTIAKACLVVVVVAATVFAYSRLSQKQPQQPRRQPKALPVIDGAAWHEKHPSIAMHPQAKPDDRDPAWMSRALAPLPRALVRKGGKIHFLVTQPEHFVLDKNGKVNRGGDGVILVAIAAGVGIDYELARITLKPHDKAEDRRWHEFTVDVPLCTPQIRLEARAGQDTGSTAMYDGVWVSVREPLVFRDDVASRPERLAAKRKQAPGCGTGTSSTTSASPQRRSPGALHTGGGRPK